MTPLGSKPRDAFELARSEHAAENSRVFTLVLVVVVVVALYLARDVLIPLALATLLTFILAPAVNRLERLRLGRIASIMIVVLAAFAVLGSVFYVVADQLVEVTDNLPQYQQRIAKKVRELKSTKTGPVAKIENAIEAVNQEIARPAPPSARDAQGSAPTVAPRAEAPEKPVPVEIVQPSGSSLSVLSNLAPGAFGGLTTVGIVILFSIFMLAAREDLRNRLIRLIGRDQITVTTQALDDAARRVGRYLRMQLIINASYGVMLTIGLYLIGLPNALLWGFLAGLLRYIPYLGAWIGAAAAVALSLAVFDSWTQPLATIGLFCVAELITGNVLEPVLFHSSTGISTIGILVAAVFWTWLWGAMGLVLSTPLTVCLAVIGRYVPQLEFFNVLLSDEPVLPPSARYYQRLLVGDEDEAQDLVNGYSKEHSLEALFEQVLLPALILTEQDANRGILKPGKREYILENVRELLEEMTEAAPDLLADLPLGDAVEPAVAVICLPARDEADELAAMMLEVCLRPRGMHVQLLSAKSLAGEMVEQVAASPAQAVFISAVPPFAGRHARYLCKRLRARNTDLPIVVATWGQDPQEKQVELRLRAAGAQQIVSQMGEAIAALEKLRRVDIQSLGIAPVPEAKEPVARGSA